MTSFVISEEKVVVYYGTIVAFPRTDQENHKKSQPEFEPDLWNTSQVNHAKSTYSLKGRCHLYCMKTFTS